MKAIFDRDCKCVGWYNENDGMIYDTEMKWIGFISRNNFFSTNTIWLGGFFQGSMVDKQGRVVAWVEGNRPQGTLPLQCPLRPLKPLTPLRPLRPLRPLKPLMPLGGWSRLNWREYINQA